MGKKYDDYVDAVAANNAAKADLAVAYGGSAQAHVEKVEDVQALRQMQENEAWAQVQEDPQG